MVISGLAMSPTSLMAPCALTLLVIGEIASVILLSLNGLVVFITL
ncbi:Uncharacterised protein [Vibrio cholerae]|nr:Uncharacterised protein [Vibrio cholerae]